MIFLQLFWTFFKIGLFTFGGGYAMLPLIEAEVTAQGWMTRQALVDFVAVSESTPGPFAVNIATYVGSCTAGSSGAGMALLGSTCATLGVVLPSFLIILLLARCYAAFQQNYWVRGALTGLRPATVGLIGAAVLSTAQTALLGEEQALLPALSAPAFWTSAGIFVLCLLLTLRKIHPIVVILVSAALGVVAGYALPLPG